MNKLLQEKQVCFRENEGNCDGRLTLDHTLIYAGKQIDEAWAIVWTCAYHHGVDEFQDCGDLDREKGVWFALNKATDEELLKYSKAVDYIAMRERLNKKYGKNTSNKR
jgi:hypothetical protein